MVFALFVLISVLRVAWYFPRLPETVASHFNGSGAADASMGKTAFAMLDIGVTLGAAVMMLGMHAIMTKLPASSINLPNHDYWFAPEREESTRAAAGWFALLFGCATLLLVQVVMHLAVRANLVAESGAPPEWPDWGGTVLGAYLAVAAVLVIWFICRFVFVPRGNGSSIHDGE